MSEVAHLNQLAAEVESGGLKLRVDRASLDAAIKGIQDLIDQIDGLGIDLSGVEHVSGLGGFTMGVQLAEKFTRKGSGEDGIAQRIQEVQTELKLMQEVILKAARAYAETDSRYADVLGRTEV